MLPFSAISTLTQGRFSTDSWRQRGSLKRPPTGGREGVCVVTLLGGWGLCWLQWQKGRVGYGTWTTAWKRWKK